MRYERGVREPGALSDGSAELSSLGKPPGRAALQRVTSTSTRAEKRRSLMMCPFSNGREKKQAAELYAAWLRTLSGVAFQRQKKRVFLRLS
jgi:hypothetical protein